MSKNKLPYEDEYGEQIDGLYIVNDEVVGSCRSQDLYKLFDWKLTDKSTEPVTFKINLDGGGFISGQYDRSTRHLIKTVNTVAPPSGDSILVFSYRVADLDKQQRGQVTMVQYVDFAGTCVEDDFPNGSTISHVGWFNLDHTSVSAIALMRYKMLKEGHETW